MLLSFARQVHGLWPLYGFISIAVTRKHPEIKAEMVIRIISIAFLQSFRHTFPRSSLLLSSADTSRGLPPARSICVSPLHSVCELRKQIHQASLNFSWLLFPPNLWVMARRQLMLCTWFSLHLWQFPLCLLVLN